MKHNAPEKFDYLENTIFVFIGGAADVKKFPNIGKLSLPGYGPTGIIKKFSKKLFFCTDYSFNRVFFLDYKESEKLTDIIHSNSEKTFIFVGHSYGADTLIRYFSENFSLHDEGNSNKTIVLFLIDGVGWRNMIALRKKILIITLSGIYIRNIPYLPKKFFKLANIIKYIGGAWSVKNIHRLRVTTKNSQLYKNLPITADHDDANACSALLRKELLKIITSKKEHKPSSNY